MFAELHHRVRLVSLNSAFAKRIGASPTISIAGHTGMPVGTDATKAALGTGMTAAGCSGSAVRTADATGVPGCADGEKYVAVRIVMYATAAIPAARATKAPIEGTARGPATIPMRAAGPISASLAFSRR